MAIRVYGNKPFAEPGSAARAEVDDTSFDGAWGRATFETVHDAMHRLASVGDHLLGLAAVTSTPGITFAAWSLARPALEGLADLYWVYDPTIDVRERVRRRHNLRLASLSEYHVMVAELDSDAAAKTADDIATIGATAQSLGWVYKADTKPWGQIVASIGKPIPRIQVRVDELVAGVTPIPKFGRLLHRMMSAVSHVQAHGFAAFVLDTESHPATPGLARARLGLDLGSYASIVGTLVLTTDVAMRRLIRYNGWSPTAWERESEPAVRDFLGWLQEQQRGPVAGRATGRSGS